MKKLPVLCHRSPLFLLSLIVILASVHPKFPVYAATQSVSITDIHQTQVAKTPILVEFFTSDKCPTCNSVESFLTHLDRDQHADIILFKEQVHPRDIPLEQHPTSAFSLTERQKDYQEYFKLTDSPTPQIIVNGAEQFTESDHSAIAASVKQAASADTYPLQFANVHVRGRNIEFSLQQAPATHREYVNVYAALLGP